MRSMILRRLLLVLLAFSAGTALRPTVRGEEAGAPATAQALCDAFQAAMKRGASLDFAARKELLGPEIRRDLDLELMTRIVVGPPWRNLGPSDRQQVVDAFSDYCIAVNVQRIKSSSGGRFEVDPTPTLLPRGDRIVHTKLYTSDPTPVQLDYLMREDGGHWRIIDVYLSGTISELAARRSEYSTILRQGGVPALVALLRRKTAELGD
jgi:phospholipid transport system substrate-binding protein